MSAHLKAIRRHLLAGVSATALLAAMPATVQAQEKPGVYGSIDGQFVITGGSATALAGTPAPITGGGTSVRPSGNGIGGGLALGYRFMSPWDIQLGAEISEPGSTTTSSPGKFTLGRLAFANVNTARQSTSHYLIDFDVGYNMQLGACDTRVFGGLRYADFSQQYAHSGTDTGAFYGYYSYSHEAYSRQVTFHGIGPVLGASDRYHIGNSNFSLVGMASGSVVFGTLHRTESVTDLTKLSSFIIGSAQESSNRQDSRAVYGVQAELAVAYALGQPLGPGPDMEVQAGYRLEQWWNVIDSGVSIGTATTGGIHGSLTEHGPFVRLKGNF